jgi:hypothetical protein
MIHSHQWSQPPALGTAVPASQSLIENLTNELSTRKHLYGANHPCVAESLNSIALVHHHMLNNSQQALMYHLQALDILISAYQIDMKDLDTERLSLCLAVTMSDVGNTHWALGDFYKAEANFIDALSLLRRENFSEAHPRAYSMRNRLFTLYRHTGITHTEEEPPRFGTYKWQQ